MRRSHSSNQKINYSIVKREIITTSDGSSSLFVQEMGETFHSRHGAVQESVHVYIKNGLQRMEKKEISVLEFGFGTGLNALLTLDYAIHNNLKIYYETIEAYPLQPAEYELLNYNDFVQTNFSLTKLHQAEWDKIIAIDPLFTILKHRKKIETFCNEKVFDLVYFDVFGYDYQPELWRKEILEKAYMALAKNGIFVTYACKGIVNRTLKEIGFEVHKTLGPPGKREMVVAVKKN